jgi:uncharacterized protein YhfF
MATNVDRYWDQFLVSLPNEPEKPPRYIESFFFGTKPEDTKEISALVLAGTKTATGAVLWAYEADGKPLPQVGDYWIVTNGGDDPVCIIQTMEVRVLPFNEVGEEYAYDGGEGDRSLLSWRTIYWDYIVSECVRIGREPSEKAPLVMERFAVIYRDPLL